MPSLRHHIVLLAVALAFLEAAIAGGGEEERAAACVEAASWPQQHQRGDRLTVVLSGYSERRLPLLRAIAACYASHPLVLAVVVLWCDPSTPSSSLLPPFPPPISLRRTSSRSLNARFLPLRSVVRTAAVAVADDDVLPDAAAISFAFATWQQQHHHNQNSSRLVGLFPRSHHLDLGQARWAYTAAAASASSSPLRYSMVLTKFMILPASLLHRYSCSPGLAAARAVVDRERNCEDILMNFVAAEASGEGPVLVEAGSVRDWGDPRNDDEGMKGVGLSGKGGMAHWEKRGGCITEFHRLLGRMPLRYSYGKVVPAGGGGSEQGLCSKHGRLVRCDDQRQ